MEATLTSSEIMIQQQCFDIIFDEVLKPVLFSRDVSTLIACVHG